MFLNLTERIRGMSLPFT